MAPMEADGTTLDARPLEAILPHRPPMILLDGVLRAADGGVRGVFTVPPDGPWVEGGRLRAAALVEVAAQTAAAAAALADLDAGRTPGRGYLGAVDGFALRGDVGSGTRLFCRIDPLLTLDGLVRVACTVGARDDGSEPLAEGVLTLAVTPAEPAA